MMVESFVEGALCRREIPMFATEELGRIPDAVDRPVELQPMAANNAPKIIGVSLPYRRQPNAATDPTLTARAHFPR